MTLNPAQFGDRPVYHGGGIAEPGKWERVSLGHRYGQDTSSEPGARWGRNIALVPVSILQRYVEVDRQGKDAFDNSAKTIDSIANDLQKGGVNALNSSLSLAYDHDSKWGYLAEGHHRLAAAIKAGITHLPVGVYGNHSDLSRWKRQGLGAPLHLDNRMVEKGGYFPSDMHPGNFQEFEGAR